MDEQEKSQGNRSLELCRRVVTTESFIAEAKEIYGNRYGYSKVDYKNRDHRVVVTCPVHGDFQVYAREHLDGKGCPKCEKGEKFIAKLKEKFGDKFGLDEFFYESSTSPVTLICPTHGAFSRLPHQILNSSMGCPECANEIARQKQEKAELAAKKNMEGKRLNATKVAMERFRSAHPKFTDEYISVLVKRAYPNKYEDNLEVAIEILKELYRSQVDLNDSTFMSLLEEWTEAQKLSAYEIETRKQWKTLHSVRQLLDKIYHDAQSQTVYLSQYEEYKVEGVKEHFDDICRTKERTLAKELFYKLNQMALDEAGELSGFILPFHCYSEPNGDVVFTKNKRTINDYDEKGNPIANEVEVVKRSTAENSSVSGKGGCLSIVIIVLVVLSYLAYI